jgi:hypothetical protein
VSTDQTVAVPSRTVPYPERWAAMPLERRRQIAGDDLVELEALRGLPDDDRQRRLMAYKARMAEVVELIDRDRASEAELRRERDRLMVAEALLGERQSAIAAEVGVTAMVVSVALGITEPQRRKP